MGETMSQFVVGKRVTVGAAVKGALAAYAAYKPEHASVAIAIAIPITFVAQVLIARYGGITTK